MTGALLLALASLAGPVKLAGKGEPVVVDAAEFQYAPRRREIVFTGEPVVTLTRGDAKLTCKRLVMRNDEGGRIQTATCEGDVHFTKAERLITCASATYDDPAARVTCEGTPVTLQEQGIHAEGTRLVYDLDTDVVNLKNSKGTIAAERLDQAEARQAERRKGQKR